MASIAGNSIIRMFKSLVFIDFLHEKFKIKNVIKIIIKEIKPIIVCVFIMKKEKNAVEIVYKTCFFLSVEKIVPMADIERVMHNRDAKNNGLPDKPLGI